MDVPHDRAKPTAVRFALRSGVPPALAEAARWGDLARTAAMARFGRMNGGALSPTLSGKDAGGKPMTGHRHAFYLPADEDVDLERLTVWTPFAKFAPDAGADDASGERADINTSAHLEYRQILTPTEADANIVMR